MTILYVPATGTVASLCNGKVFTVQENIGSTIHEFAQEVAQVEAARGRVTYRIRNMRMSIGQSTTVAGEWASPAGTWEVAFAVLNSDEPQVIRRFSRVVSGCRGPGQ
ncbi:MAG TPA: hypothetical protein PKX06_09650 [Phenylobacterium sp.]|nr:hypothetical protein [Phenylobacterium sp.]